MAEATSNPKDLGPEITPGQRMKRAAIGALFYLILLIPRVRRLRRRVKLWTAIRVVIGFGGLGLTWLSLNGRGWGSVIAATLLILFALVVSATPVQKTIEERGRELGALAVLNGGTLVRSPVEAPRKVNIFAGSELLTIEGGLAHILMQVPIARIQSCRARALEPGEGKPWELEIAWDSSGPMAIKFRFDGFFAEHLARVAEATIENLRRKEFTVLK